MTWYYGHPRKQTIDLLSLKIPYTRPKPITALVAEKSKVFRSARIVKAIYGPAWDGNVKITAPPQRQSSSSSRRSEAKANKLDELINAMRR